jgi:hypothetical protein
MSSLTSSLTPSRITIGSAFLVRIIPIPRSAPARRVSTLHATIRSSAPLQLGECPIISNEPSNENQPCHWSFPQNPFILSLLPPSLNGTSSPSFQTWEFLANTTGLLPLHTQCASLAKASAAMLILSIFLTAFTVTLTLAVKRAWLACALILDGLDAGLLLAAAVMWTTMIKSLSGPGQVPMFNTSATVSIGPGFWVLWVAVLGKLLVLPRAWWEHVVWPSLKILFWCSCECLKNANSGLRSWDNRIEQAEGTMMYDLAR